MGKRKEDNEKTVSWARDAQGKEWHLGFSPMLVCKQSLLLLLSVESFSQSRDRNQEQPAHPIGMMLWHGSSLAVNTLVHSGVNLSYWSYCRDSVWQCDVNGVWCPDRPCCQGKVWSASVLSGTINSIVN